MHIFKLHEKIVEALRKDAKENNLDLSKLEEYISNFSSDDFIFKNMEPSFQEIFLKNIHNKFIDLNNSQYPGHKVIIRNWFDGFVDRDNDIIYKFQKVFHGPFWEIYLYAILKENNFIIDFDKSPNPDFIVTSPVEMCIEACSSNVAEINNRPIVQDKDRSLKKNNFSLKKPLWKEDESLIKEIIDVAIIRYTHSILSKHKKYSKIYSKKDFVKNKPFLLALTSYAQLDYGRENHYGAVATFYGKYLSKMDESYGFTQIESIMTEKGEKRINLFNLKNNGVYKYKYISAVIFSSKITLGKVTSLAEQLDIKYKKNINYIFHVYEDLKNGKIDLRPVTKYIEDKFIDENLVRHYSSILSEVDCNPENVSNFRDELLKNTENKVEPYDLIDGLFILHNPNAENKISMDLFDHPRIVQVYQDSTTGELKFYKNSKTLVSSFNYPWFMYPENDPIGFQNLVRENFNSI
ncbi:hypothetical protein E0H80_02255 [Acinetobacter sp. ANC 4779]|uniref:hypothetical protein n=1 Tax=Acinetobacter sp. ANC 4779 TaxID=2529848 RepID=UPI00103F12BD|nr:hypothetical protein [Acinetobacter sp. ANC 4779]TCB52677.1 hypothetical protein E0H80_02255 [Acinetobacter sp. ANC 4779]